MRPAGRRQRGVAAIELALMMPVLVLMLVLPLFLGRVLWHYTVIQHAAQDAARFLSKVPVSEMINTTRAPLLSGVAKAIGDQEVAGLAPGSSPCLINVFCDGGPCAGYARPSAVRVYIQVPVEDTIFPGYMPESITLIAEVSYPYVGK